MNNEKLTDEHIARLETALANIENDYRPTCESVSYGSGCPGPTDASLDFWRCAVDCLPSILAELRAHRQAALSDADKQIVIIALREYVDRDVDHGHEDGNTAAARWALDRLTTEQP